ncbi:urease accessory protein UreD [Sodiomyces alkalinus F11]|uniref:Urease accessory protein UreD n=1 Tax=Sodiomyces alkalinus (strain CBS 110278 / VKM F-3762 / F11) TaxID=1314773 RepID=A0A3N2Q277_SODAK|nr:urease accessory protein UreD [Sodiomyces alkalinus F11]ROT40864.1 urease accessory protein UreD [Sodiomyces alkalinus F11]
MQSPFPKSNSASGEGRIVAKLLPNGLPGLETVTYKYPLKLISPSPTAEQKSALVFLLSYGGGLVGGDSIQLAVEVSQNARLSVVTQGHTKILKSPSPDVITRQNLSVRVADDAGLCLLPDPVQPFAGSVYEQTQVFTVTASASLCLLDWVTQGRSALGEDWSFVRWKGRNEVWLTGGEAAPAEDRLLLRDTVVLDEGSRDLTGKGLHASMHGHGLFGTLILRGKQMTRLGEFFLSEFSSLPRLGARDFRSAEVREKEDSNKSAEEQWRLSRLHAEKQHGILWSAASIRGCVVVKFGAKTVEGGRLWIGDMLSREGSISELYGDQAMMCVR